MSRSSAGLFRTLTLIAITLCMTLVGCSRDTEPTSQSKLAKLRFASSSQHHTLDPQKMTWVHDARIARSIYQPLVVHTMPDLKLEGGVAESWTISDDGLTYTFNLRPEAKWSNGDDVIADHFIYAWRRALSPDFAADYSQLLMGIKGASDYYTWRGNQTSDFIKLPQGQRTEEKAAQLWDEAKTRFAQTVGIKAIDDHTLEVTLENPSAYFLELCSFPTFTPNHPPSVEAHSGFSVETGWRTIDPSYFSSPELVVTNGPYKLDRQVIGERTELAPNPRFWDKANVKNSGIIERVFGEPQAALLAYGNGELDWLPDLPTASSLTADLVAEKRADIHVTPAAATYFYNFNCAPTLPDGSRNPLADPRVRQALSMCINRKQIVDQVTRLGQPVGTTFVPVGSIDGYDAPEFAAARYEPAKARQLLAEAGYPDGKGIDGLSFLYNTGHGHEDIAQVITRTWANELGISVPLEGITSKEFGDRLRSGGYQIARASWFGDYRDPTTFLDKFVSDNGNNDANYVNDAFDNLMKDAATTTDPETRMQRLAEAEALMLAEQPVAPIFYYVIVDVYDPAVVEGISPNMWNIRRLEHVRVSR